MLNPTSARNVAMCAPNPLEEPETIAVILFF